MTNAFVSSGLHSSTISLCHRRRQRVCQHGKTVTMSTNGTGRPQRVAIVGAGISGLMTALALVRKGGVPAEGIDIFEPRESVDDGQGASLNLNGGNILLSECYGIDLSSEASPIERIIARNAVGRTLYQLDVRNAAQRLGADKLISPSGQMLAVMAMRDKVQHILQDAVSDAGVRIHRGSKYAVSNVDLGGETRPFARLQLADGQLTDAYDLVVGADGVRSHVRKAVAGDGKRLTARYTGFRVLWGVGNTVNEASIPHGELHQWFGNGCYALHVSAGPRDAKRDIVAINFRDPRPRDENEGYRQGGDAICERAEQLLFDAGLPHSLRDVFHSSQRFIETPVYSHVTTGWSKKGACVLVGDSAHAMAPYLGQGANQAIQDAHVLACTIANIGTDFHDLTDALHKYEQARRPTTMNISRSSSITGLVETQKGRLGTFGRDTLLTIAGATGAIERALIIAFLPRVGKYKS